MIENADISHHEMTCDEAWLYCLTLEHNGYKDWRMPTYRERIEFGFFSTWDQGDISDFIRNIWVTHLTCCRIVPVRDLNGPAVNVESIFKLEEL